ncbi:MAG: hypothetical protein GY777_12375 [Candidatus Brocadiaceae bacterium]|nr:hypothetical protein [Candidatus Brocadiaceae bacterium]
MKRKSSLKKLGMDSTTALFRHSPPTTPIKFGRARMRIRRPSALKRAKRYVKKTISNILPKKKGKLNF